MIKIIGILLTLIAADFYLFPFEPSVLPSGINVKMILAGLALPCIAFHLASQRKALVSKDFIIIVCLRFQFHCLVYYRMSIIIQVIFLLIFISYQYLSGWQQALLLQV